MTMGTSTVTRTGPPLGFGRRPGKVARAIESLRARAASAREVPEEEVLVETGLPRIDRPFDPQTLLAGDRFRFNRLS
jgi:hypothetical protein